jgi:hypothetical protein
MSHAPVSGAAARTQAFGAARAERHDKGVAISGRLLRRGHRCALAEVLVTPASCPQGGADFPIFRAEDA